MIVSHKKLAKLCEVAVKQKSISVDNIQVYTTKLNNGITIIIFRGTEFETSLEGLKDLWTNLNAFILKTEDCGNVHRGCYKGALKACVALEKTLIKGSKLILAGFSLGGALALLSSNILKSKGFEVLECVSFGAPSVVCNDKSVYKYKNVIQYVHLGDIVPAKFYKFRNYIHINKFYIGSKSTISWKDHDIDSYIENL